MEPAPIPTTLPLRPAGHGHLPACLWPLARTRRLRAGEVLAPAPGGGSDLHVVAAGVLLEETVGPSGRSGVLDLLGPGDPFGDLPLAAGVPVEGSVARRARAAVPSAVRSLAASSVGRLAAVDPAVAAWLAARLAARLARVERSLAISLTLPVADRVLAVLEAMAERFGGSASTGGREIMVPLTQDGLAAAVGATRESVNRALRELAGAGLVGRSGRRYRLSGPTARTAPRRGPP